jgi:peptidoglycan/xylan/chitin deacetylase (PgdA/CDA1 family)
MTLLPLDRALAFWKPALDPAVAEGLAVYTDPEEPPARGINALRAGSEPASYRLADGGPGFRLFARVHPIETVPPSAEIVAEILDASGAHYSYVLWFPGTGSVVVPFDPNEAVELFWHEDYVPVADRTALPKPLLALYYSVGKRLMPAGLRRLLRRSMARRALTSPSALDWPADRSLDLLQLLLLRLIMLAIGRQELEFAWFWPDRHPWAVTLTHDVETADGLARVKHVAELERARGLRSSFNMVPRDYDVPDSFVRELGEDGFEVGVHGLTHDGLLFSSRAVFDERAPAIRDFARRWGATGFRSPATYRNREWLPLLEFEYDSSFSNTAPCEPQPGGCGSFFPFPLDGMVELPITLPQDHTLFELLQETGPETWLDVLRLIRGSNGMACVLAHPDPTAGYTGMPANEASYVGVLDAVAGSEAWTPLPRDLARWWKARAETTAGDISALEGASFGTAVLDASGRVSIVPPAR